MRMSVGRRTSALVVQRSARRWRWRAKGLLLSEDGGGGGGDGDGEDHGGHRMVTGEGSGMRGRGTIGFTSASGERSVNRSVNPSIRQSVNQSINQSGGFSMRGQRQADEKPRRSSRARHRRHRFIAAMFLPGWLWWWWWGEGREGMCAMPLWFPAVVPRSADVTVQRAALLTHSPTPTCNHKLHTSFPAG